MQRDFYIELIHTDINSENDIQKYMEICESFDANKNDIENANLCYSEICNKFANSIQYLEKQIDTLRQDFESMATMGKAYNLRKQGDKFYEITEDLLPILDILPNDFTSDGSNLIYFKKIAYYGGSYITMLMKVASNKYAKRDLGLKKKLKRIVSPLDANTIESEYDNHAKSVETSLELVLSNHKLKGQKNQIALINKVYNHRLLSIKYDIQKDTEPRQTIVHVTDRLNLLWFVLALAAPIVGFYLYDHIYMFFCVLLVAIMQFVPISHLADGKTEDIVISANKMQTIANHEIVLNIVMRVLFVVLAFLNTFPFFASNKAFMLAMRGNEVPAYEGGFLVVILTLVLIGAWLHAAYSLPKPEILKSLNSLKETGVTPEELLEAKLNREKEEHARENELKTWKYGEGFRDFGYGVVVNNVTKKIFINDIEYNYKDVLSYDLRDNSHVVESSKTTSYVKTDNGDAGKRALVGGLLFGTAGAVIGAATTKQKTEETIHTEITNSTEYKYSITITLNNKQCPSTTILVYSVFAMSNIKSALDDIIKQNNSNEIDI